MTLLQRLLASPLVRAAGLFATLAFLTMVVTRMGVTHDLTFDLTTDGASPKWAANWTRAGDGQRNGAWLDLERRALDALSPGDTATLTIDLPGKATIEGRRQRLWLYEIRPLRSGDAAPDLKRSIADPAKARGRWVEFSQGPGVVYEGDDPGSLALQVPAAGVEIRVAKTRDGGPTTFALAGEATTIDLSAEADGGHTFTLRPKSPHNDRTIRISQRLPAYPLSELALEWYDQPATALAKIANVHVEERVFGFLTASRPALQGSQEPGVALTIDLAKGRLVLMHEAAAGWAGGGVRRLAVVGGGCAGAIALGWLAFVVVRRRLRRGPWRFLTLDVFAIFVAFTVHAWMLSWAPFMHCPDSIDYLSGVARYVEPGGTLDQFKAVRVPGYAVFVAPFWRYAGDDFNYALGLAQTLLNFCTSILAYLTARRLMPKPWPAITLLLVACNPVLLLWSRFAMSETLSAFVAALAGYVLVRFFHVARGADTPRERPRWLFLIVGAAVLGVLGGLGPYIRGNFQILTVLVPLAIGMALWKRLGLNRAAVVAGVSLAIGTAIIAPRILQNKREFGVASFMVGVGYQSNIWTQDVRVFDYNQTRVFSFERQRELDDLVRRRATNTWAILPEFLRVDDWPGLDDRKDWGQSDLKYAYPTHETWSRRPVERWERAATGFINIVGLYPWLDIPGYAENSHWTHPLRGHARGWPIMNHFYEDSFIDRFDAKQRAVFDRTSRDISRLRKEVNPQIIDHLFGADRLLRPIFAGLMILGAAAWVLRREWAAAMVPGLVLANAGALAILALGGIDRYGVPFEPLLRIGAAYGAFQLFTWLNSKKM